MTEQLKKYESIGCCGIDCGLCPRFHTQGHSACPGCGGLNFKEKHPSCGFLTCCVIKNGHEVCSTCNDYPCTRFNNEKSGYDSFVTHGKVFSNLDFIKSRGMGQFIDQQKMRIDLLTEFLTNFNDGRSKSFFCISCALLPLDTLQEAHRFMKGKQNDNMIIKEKSRLLKDKLQLMAGNLNIVLKLNRKN